MGAIQTENLHDDPDTGNDLLRILLTDPVVGNDVGFALAGIDDDGVHLADAGGKLYMSGEGRAAHADDAGFPDDAHQILGGQGIHFRLGTGLDILAQGIFVVIFDDHTHHGGSVGMGTGSNHAHLTGNGGMDRHTQALIITDLLTLLDQITLLDQGLAGRADMLGHGDYQRIACREFHDLLLFSVPFIFFGMNPSEKGKRHNCHLFQNLRHFDRII